MISCDILVDISTKLKKKLKFDEWHVSLRERKVVVCSMSELDIVFSLLVIGVEHWFYLKGLFFRCRFI